VPQAQELADIRCEQVANVDSHEIDSAMLLALARQQGAMFMRLIRVPGKVWPLRRQTMRFGLVAAGSLNPQKARRLLMLTLGTARDFCAAQRYFDRY
jgi:L-asparaginase